MINQLNKETGIVEEIPKFEIIKNGRIVSKLGNENVNDPIFDPEKIPVATFYAKYFLEDIFADCNISSKAFNIQILDLKEQVLFEEIRNKNLFGVNIQGITKELGVINIVILNEDDTYNIEGIKKLKLILGTKQYTSGIATLKDGSKYSF